MIAITGITGHSGRYFYQELIKHKYKEEICFLVRESSDTTFIANQSNFHIIKVDLNQDDSLTMALSNIDTIIHIAGIQYSLNIVKAAIINKCKRLIVVHTTGSYSKYKEAASEYIKIDQELARYQTQIKITVLRPTMIYGDLCDHNMSKFIKMIDQLKLYPNIAGGHCLIQPVHAADLGLAYYQVLTNSNTEGKEYNLSGEKPIELIKCLKIIKTQLNSHNLFIHVPLWLAIFSAKCLKFISLGKIDIIEKVQRMGEDRSYDHQAATRDFGFQPRCFEQGIYNEIIQYKEMKK